jgi:prevent-host-death family protein
VTNVGAYHVKTHLAELLDRVERGERITITRHGHAVAHLIPVAGSAECTVDEAVAGIVALRKGRTLGPDLTVRNLIDEGRR